MERTIVIRINYSTLLCYSNDSNDTRGPRTKPFSVVKVRVRATSYAVREGSVRVGCLTLSAVVGRFD